MNRRETNITQLFASPLMQVQLDLDLEKLTEFAFETRNKDKIGVQRTNKGGWHSNDIREEKHEEFIKLKREINQYLQIWHSEVLQGMKFKGNVTQNLIGMWVNINEKHHYNEWHIHPYSTLSGVYYIKHDGSDENGNISFKHPNNLYMTSTHWPPDTRMIEQYNEVTSEVISIIPQPNRLLIFPSWLEHKAEMNLKDDTRISLSFNTQPTLDKRGQWYEKK
jgi:uncharacterized protein (TIGR02466 family)